MPVNKILRNPISDALEAQNRHQPIKQPGGVVIVDGGDHAVIAQISSEIVEVRRHAGQTTDRVHDD